MTVTEFFEYLHDHPATTSLAETIAAVLGGGRRPELVPIPVPTRDHRLGVPSHEVARVTPYQRDLRPW